MRGNRCQPLPASKFHKPKPLPSPNDFHRIGRIEIGDFPRRGAGQSCAFRSLWWNLALSLLFSGSFSLSSLFSGSTFVSLLFSGSACTFFCKNPGPYAFTLKLCTKLPLSPLFSGSMFVSPLFSGSACIFQQKSEPGTPRLDSETWDDFLCLTTDTLFMGSNIRTTERWLHLTAVSVREENPQHWCASRASRSQLLSLNSPALRRLPIPT